MQIYFIGTKDAELVYASLLTKNNKCSLGVNAVVCCGQNYMYDS